MNYAINYTISCCSFCFQARGDSIFNTQKTVNVRIDVREAVGHLEVTSDYLGNAHLRSFTVHHIDLQATYSGDLNLNSKRSTIFKELIQDNVKQALYGVLYGSFKDVLARAIRLPEFPH